MVYVSEVVHKTFIETTEVSTADAEGLGWKKSVWDPTFHGAPSPFVFDYPFVFMIKHKTKTLFMGKVKNPAQLL